MSSPEERRLPPVFPSKGTLMSGGTVSPKALVEIERSFQDGGPLAGYLVAEGEHDALYLLFLKERPYGAGLFRDGTMEPLGISEFFNLLFAEEGGERSFDFFSVDPTVLLLIAVHFQKRPALSVTTDLASPEEILGKVEEAGHDAIIALVDGALRHVIYCKDGIPVRFHPAGDVAVPEEESLLETITVFCFERGSSRPLTMEIYDDLEVAPAPDHGEALSHYTLPGGPPVLYELNIFEGAKQLESRFFRHERCVIGRAKGADLRLQDSAVSREHAAIEVRGSQTVLRDMGSDNGTWINNRKVKGEHTLRSGDEIRVGRLRLVFRPLGKDGGFVAEETMQLDSTTLGARVVFQGATYPVVGEGLIIGKGDGADIQIGGFLVAPRHAHVYRDDDGHYYLVHLGGARKPTVNGDPVKRHRLSTGDAIRIGNEAMRFYDAD